jgi:hypothetical protein
MKKFRAMCLVLVLGCAVAALAQSPGAAPSGNTAAAQQPQPPAPTIASVVDREISIIEKRMVDLAEAMPEDKFNFAPGSLEIKGADFKGVRTFAEQIKHVAGANYNFWGALTGEKPPAGKGPGGTDELKTKAEIIKLLKDSYAVGHRAAATLTPENLLELVPFGQAKATRLFLATFGVAQAFDHYGQLVEYLRMNGIIPPASRPQQ